MKRRIALFILDHIDRRIGWIAARTPIEWHIWQRWQKRTKWVIGWLHA